MASLAFETIYEQHRRAILSFIIHRYPTLDFGTAQDVLGNVFVRVLQRRHRLVTIHNIRGYLFAMSRNVIRDRYRGRHHQVEVAADRASAALPVSATLELDAISLQVSDALDALAEPLHRVLELHLHGLSAKKIALQIGCTESTASHRLHKAKATLKAGLSRCGRRCARDDNHPELCLAENKGLRCPKWLTLQGLRESSAKKSANFSMPVFGVFASLLLEECSSRNVMRVEPQ